MLELSQPRRLTYRESLSCCVDWAKFFYWLWTNWDAHVNPLLANMPPPIRFRFVNKIIYFFERDIREAFPNVGHHLPKITNTVPVPYRYLQLFYTFCSVRFEWRGMRHYVLFFVYLLDWKTLLPAEAAISIIWTCRARRYETVWHFSCGSIPIGTVVSGRECARFQNQHCGGWSLTSSGTWVSGHLWWGIFSKTYKLNETFSVLWRTQ